MYRTKGDFLLRFPGLADISYVRADRQIAVDATGPASAETLEHLLLDQALPRAISDLGRTVIHAGAVRINGRAALFLGESGAGKSTLVASLFRAGYALLSDDAVVLGKRDDYQTALATYPSLRLWPSSLESVADPAAQVAPMAHYSAKRRLLLDSEDRIEVGDVRIGGLFVINIADVGIDSPVTATRLPERDATIELVKAGFRLDPTDPVVAARDMQRAAEVAKAVPAWRLTYPRDFSVLGHVRDAILAKMNEGAG